MTDPYLDGIMRRMKRRGEEIAKREEMTDTKPTLEEQIDWANALIGCDSAVAPAVLESLLELQSIRSAELPVEPEPLGIPYTQDELLRDRQRWIDYGRALKSFALKWREEADNQFKYAGRVLEQSYKAESELAALRGRLMDLDAKDWLDTLADADKAMSAVILKEGK